MNCKRMQDVILTDYIDGQLSSQRVRDVEYHLAQCASCRVLAQDARKNIDDAFSGVKNTKVDDFVWIRIKNKIEQQESIEHLSVSRVDVLKSFVYPFKRWAVALGIFLILGLSMLVRQNLGQQEPYLTYILASDNQGSDDVTTGIESYFL